MKSTIPIFLQFVFLCEAGLIEERSPHWENLECETGHKYFLGAVAPLGLAMSLSLSVDTFKI